MKFRIFVKYKNRWQTLDCNDDGWFLIEGKEEVRPFGLNAVKYALESIEEGFIPFNKNSTILLEPVE